MKMNSRLFIKNTQLTVTVAVAVAAVGRVAGGVAAAARGGARAGAHHGDGAHGDGGGSGSSSDSEPDHIGDARNDDTTADQFARLMRRPEAERAATAVAAHDGDHDVTAAADADAPSTATAATDAARDAVDNFGLTPEIDGRDLRAFEAELKDGCVEWDCVVCAQRLGARDKFPRRVADQTIDLNNGAHQALLGPLTRSGCERDVNDPSHYFLEPILAARAQLRICTACRTSLRGGVVPKFCYRRFPIAPVPPELRNMSRVVRSLVALNLGVQTLYARSMVHGASGAQLESRAFALTVTTNTARVLDEQLPRVPRDVVMCMVSRRRTYHDASRTTATTGAHCACCWWWW